MMTYQDGDATEQLSEVTFALFYEDGSPPHEIKAYHVAKESAKISRLDERRFKNVAYARCHFGDEDLILSNFLPLEKSEDPEFLFLRYTSEAVQQSDFPPVGDISDQTPDTRRDVAPKQPGTLVATEVPFLKETTMSTFVEWCNKYSSAVNLVLALPVIGAMFYFAVSVAPGMQKALSENTVEIRALREGRDRQKEQIEDLKASIEKMSNETRDEIKEFGRIITSQMEQLRQELSSNQKEVAVLADSMKRQAELTNMLLQRMINERTP